MHVTDLRCFLVLAEDLDPQAAARRLGVSESALFAATARLQLDFGRAFLETIPGGCRLTPAGRVMVTYGVRLLAAADEMLLATRAAHREAIAAD